MITTTQNRIARQTATEPARRSAGTRSTQSDFQSLFSQATPRTAAATTPGSVSANTTGKTATGAKAPAGSAKASGSKTQASASTAAATGSQPASTSTQNTASASPFSRESVENSMNTWLKGVLQRQNEVRMQLYQNALEGWKNTNARNRELGLPEISAPAAPELAEVASMPAGYWFRIDS